MVLDLVDVLTMRMSWWIGLVLTGFFWFRTRFVEKTSNFSSSPAQEQAVDFAEVGDSGLDARMRRMVGQRAKIPETVEIGADASPGDAVNGDSSPANISCNTILISFICSYVCLFAEQAAC